MIPTKSYTLTLDECVEAFRNQMIPPSRTIAPGLLTLGVVLALLMLVMYPIMAHSPRVREILLMAYIGCGVAVALALLLWRWEGKSSVRRATLEFQKECRVHLMSKEVSFDDQGWSVRHEDGSEDRRKYDHIQGCWEKATTVTVYADIVHVFPKRIFSEPELAELKRVFQIVSDVPGADRKPESAPVAFLGIMEYALWHRRMLAVFLVLLPIVAAPWAFRTSADNLRTGLPDYTVAWWKVIIAIAVWYSVVLIYNAGVAIRFARKVRYLAFTDAGFSYSYEKKIIYTQWSQFSAARVGASCFLMSSTPGSYQLICKRVLSQPEIELLRAKVASITANAKEAVVHPPVGASHA